jgi:phage replication-related protein YjqB (UPF0714/DUF867 family)
LPKKGDLLSYAELTRLTYEGPDFVVSSSKGNGAYLIVAPHGGVIEPGTDLLAKMIANNGNYGLYTFTSNKQICDDISGCRAMHITSTKFNEPALEKLLAYYTSTTGVPVSIHGYGSLDKQEPYPGETTNMIISGGRNSGLKEIISNNLRTLGFSTDVRNSSKDGPFSGTNPNNFINITNPSGGVQIEVSRKYLRLFFYSDSAKCNLQPTNNANLFVNAILKSISDYDVIRGQQVCDSEGNCQILDENAPPKDLLQEARSMLDSAGFSKELLPEKYVVSGSVEIDGTKISARLTNKICSKNKSGTLILGDSKDHRICYNVTKNNLSSCGGDDTAIEGMDGKGFGITAGIIRIKIVGDKVKTTADVWPANITKTVPVSENGPPNFEICD